MAIKELTDDEKEEIASDLTRDLEGEKEIKEKSLRDKISENQNKRDIVI